MKDNKELKIAAIVGTIMAVFCIIMIMYASSNNEVKVEEMPRNEFAIFKNETVNGERSYIPCTTTGEELSELYTEYNKILTATTSANKASITGTYRVGFNDKFIAFDDESAVYIKEQNKLFTFESTLYKKVIEICNKAS